MIELFFLTFKKQGYLSLYRFKFKKKIIRLFQAQDSVLEDLQIKAQ